MEFLVTFVDSQDYMLVDPFINGIAEFHDRHRAMRLDVDNMSYEVMSFSFVVNKFLDAGLIDYFVY